MSWSLPYGYFCSCTSSHKYITCTECLLCAKHYATLSHALSHVVSEKICFAHEKMKGGLKKSDFPKFREFLVNKRAGS